MYRYIMMKWTMIIYHTKTYCPPLFPTLGTQVFDGEYKVQPITITRKSVWQAVANRSNLAQDRWRKLPVMANSSNFQHAVAPVPNYLLVAAQHFKCWCHGQKLTEHSDSRALNNPNCPRKKTKKCWRGRKKHVVIHIIYLCTNIWYMYTLYPYWKWYALQHQTFPCKHQVLVARSLGWIAHSGQLGLRWHLEDDNQREDP